jgi:uroporphyrinogen-III synthase
LRKRVILTRSEEDIEKDRKVFEDLGFEVVPLPLIDTVPLDFEMPRLKVDYVVFQSAKAVRFFLRKAEIPEGAEVVAVGEGTRRFLEGMGVEVHMLPEEWNARGIVRSFPEGSGEVVLVPRSKKGREEVLRGLEEKGYRVVPLEVYDTICVRHTPSKVREVLSGGGFIVFASPSAVKGLFANLQKEEILRLVKGLVVVAIGKTTKKELERRGLDPKIVPKKPLMEEVAREVERFWQENC